MTTIDLLQISSPFRWSIWDLVPVQEAVALLAYARPVPAIVCAAVAAVFLIQGIRYLAKVRKESGSTKASPRRMLWLRGSMALGFLLALAWIALLVIELRYPDPAVPIQTQEVKP